MKKLLVVLLALLTVGALFAQVSVSEWGRIGVAPIATATETYTRSGVTTQPSPVTAWYDGTLPSWASGARVGLTFSGSADDMGFTLNVNSNGGNSIGIGDQAKVWAKFGTMATLSLGSIQGDTLRGKIGNDSVSALGGLGYGPMGGEDAIFQRFYPSAGALVELTPVAGLYAAAAMDTKDLLNKGVKSTYELADAVYDMQVGAGYTIEGIGLARVQYIGKNAGRPVQAAFAYTGLAGLTVDVGVTYPLEESKAQNKWIDDYVTTFGIPAAYTSMFYWYDYQVLSAHVGANYSKDALSVAGRVDVYFPGTYTVSSTHTSDTILGITITDDSKVTEDQSLSLGFWVDGSYKVADKLSVGVEGQYQMAGEKTTTSETVAITGLGSTTVSSDVAMTKSSLAVFPYANVAFSKGSLRTGFVLGSSDILFTATSAGSSDTAEVADLAWGIPVVITFSF